jgi:hypothetical protein
MVVRNFEISVDTLSTLITVSKKMKSQIVVFYKTGIDYPVEMYGFYEGLLKTISDKKLECLNLPLIGIAIESKYLTELEKEINECKDGVVTIHSIGDVRIFNKSIQYRNVTVPLLEFWTYFETIHRVTEEIGCSPNIGTYILDANEEFLSMLETKSADGLSALHIGEHLIYASPSMLNVNKGDEVAIEIRKANVGKFAVFTINKPKKKCMVTVIYRILDLRK